MRPSTLLISLIAVAGCGGAGPVAPPPPPGSPSTAPASLTLQAGDGQQGSAGSTLPVKPAVLVKDASGRPVPNILVAFTIDSGGGSLSGGSATTNGGGIATAGDWTLGAAGSNVLRATVGGLPPVRFHAMAVSGGRPLFTAAATGAGGAVLRYGKAGDPLDGLTLSVPAGAYTGTTSWTMTADSSIQVALPEGFALAAAPLVVSNGKGYADSVMTLKVPMSLAADQALAPFYYDPPSGKLEAIPMVDRTASYATLGTRHFSNDQLANVPHAAHAVAGVASGAAVSAFGTVVIVWVKTPITNLQGTYSSAFRPGVDDWEFENYGDYAAPDGDCEGMSITAMYYHYFIKNAGVGSTGLFHQFDQSLANQWDNVQGIRFAGSVQADYLAHWSPAVNQIQALVQQAHASGVAAQDWTATWIALTIKLIGVPVLLALEGRSFAHAVVAYAVTTSGSQVDVSFADPNAPGVARTMTFLSGTLSPLRFSLNATAPPDTLNTAYALGVSAEIPLSQLDARWTEFLQQRSGTDRYPGSYSFVFYNPLNGQYEPLSPVIRTSSPTFYAAIQCPSCPDRYVGNNPADLMRAETWDAAGQNWVSDGQVTLAPGTTDYVVVGKPLTPYGFFGQVGFIDSRKVSVLYRPFSIQPRTLTGSANVKYTFTAVDNGLFAPGSLFGWYVREGTNNIGGNDTTSNRLDFQFDHSGSFVVVVVLWDANGRMVGIDSSFVTIDPPLPVWRFTSVTATYFGPTPLNDFSGQVQVWFNQDANIFSGLHGRPDGGLLFYFDAPVTSAGKTFAAGLYLQGNFPSTSFVGSWPTIPLARTGSPPYPDAFVDDLLVDQPGSLTSGKIDGHAVTRTRDMSGWPPATGVHTVTHWEVHAVKNGSTLSGTFTYYVEQWGQQGCNQQDQGCFGGFGGTSGYRFDFVATRLK